MKLLILLTLLAGTLATSAPSITVAKENPDQARAIAEIKKFGGAVEIDEKNVEKPFTPFAWHGREAL